MKKIPGNIEAAKEFALHHYPQCELAILAGSTVRNENTATSDLDIVIIDAEISNCHRESFFENGWPIEAFVHSMDTCKKWIDKDIFKRKPSMPTMMTEGVLIKGSETHFTELRDYSAARLLKGPRPFDDDEDRCERYFITELLDDFIGSNNHYDDIFILNELLDKTVNYQLVKSGKWMAHNKRMRKSLIVLEGGYSDRYFAAIDEFYGNDNKMKIIELLENVLEIYGGRLFSGYVVGKI